MLPGVTLAGRPALGGVTACFTAWVRETWPDRPDFVAIDGKTSRRSHGRNTGKAPLHLVSAFATTARLVLGQEAVSDKSNEITAIPILVERLAASILPLPRAGEGLGRRHVVSAALVCPAPRFPSPASCATREEPGGLEAAGPTEG